MNYDIQFLPCYNCGHDGHKLSVSLSQDTHPKYQKFICSNTNCNRKQITVSDTLNRLFIKAFSRQRNMRNSVVEDPRRAIPQIAYGALGMTGAFVMGRQHPENKTANLNFDRGVAKLQYCRQPKKRDRQSCLFRCNNVVNRFSAFCYTTRLGWNSCVCGNAIV